MNCVLALTFDQVPLSMSFSASCWENLNFFFRASHVANISFVMFVFFGGKFWCEVKSMKLKKRYVQKQIECKMRCEKTGSVDLRLDDSIPLSSSFCPFNLHSLK